jgi:hypothetical protein
LFCARDGRRLYGGVAAGNRTNRRIFIIDFAFAPRHLDVRQFAPPILAVRRRHALELCNVEGSQRGHMNSVPQIIAGLCHRSAAIRFQITSIRQALKRQALAAR